MSQSPVTEAPEEEAISYRQGWRALNRLLHEDRSFSGNEKHCAFLNTGPDAAGNHRPFADVSAAIGFNFDDDGRGLAFADWDFDGDLDVWTTSRTAPRVRFLRNNNPTGNHFLAIRLQGNGTSTNRDAIGARVELHLAGESVPRLRTLHAGHGFISQSSRWLHFGLGANDKIQKIVVKWPAGGREEITKIAADGYYLIVQDSARARPWAPPKDRLPLTASAPQLLPSSAESRLIVPPGMPAPAILTVGKDNQLQPLQRAGKGPLLVNLWASWCIPCREELKHWTRDAEMFRKAGIEVVALSTIGADGTATDKARADAQRVIRETLFPFATGEAAPVTVRSLDFFRSACLDLWEPLPVPSSFLLEPNGNVLAIYSGPVEAARVVADARLVSASPEERRRASVPFPGIWVGPPVEGDLMRVATQMIDRDEAGLAVAYLQQFVRTTDPNPSEEGDRRHLGDVHYLLGILLGEGNRLQDARRHLEEARRLIPHDVRIQAELQQVLARLGESVDAAAAELAAKVEANPDDLALREQLGLHHLQSRRFPAAIEQLEVVVQRDPKRANARFYLAHALVEGGRPADAVNQFKQTLSANPRLLDAADRLAWILAAHPDESVRVPQEGLALATRLCQITQNQNPRYLDTLAIGHAANGQFEAAAASAQKALAILRKDPARVAETTVVQQRLELFKAKKPYLEQRWATKP